MAVRIRLQRHGRKARPFYHIVVADSRAPRDGRFIERLGSYNPTTNPATIDINLDKAVEWLFNGAQPSETARAILSYKGVLYKKYLTIGVKKGVITQEEADQKFSTWMASKEGQVMDKIKNLSDSKDKARKAALAAELKVAEDRQKAIDARKAEAAAAEAAADSPAEATTEEETSTPESSENTESSTAE